MAVYVMSDLHGEYEKYQQMLEKIAFSEADTLYILGDVLDRGPEPVKLLQDLSMRYNVYPVIGNHELMALDILEDLLAEITEENYATHMDENFIGKLLEWQQNGGDVTLKQFQKLSHDERFVLVDYLRDFAPYEVADVGDQTFILVHSSLGNFSPEKSLREYTLEELTFLRADYEKRLFDDPAVYVISGHTPTLAITGKAEIYQKNNQICVDCGAAYGGRLACLRLDDMAEFYV